MKTEKDIENLIEYMGTNITGIRPGDILIGSKKSTKGSRILVKSGIVGPYKNDILNIQKFPHLWSQFKIKLMAFDHFKGVKDIDTWFKNNWCETDPFISDFNVRLQIIQLNCDKLNSEAIDTLMKSNHNSEDGLWSGSDIENLVPRKPGSKARKHTLIMKTDFWAIDTSTKATVSDNCEIIFDLSCGNDYTSLIINNSLKLNNDDDVKGDILVKLPITVFDQTFIFNKYNISNEEVLIFKNLMRNLTPAAYKSLIQKLIRYQSHNILYKDGTMSTKKMLILSIVFLALEPGAFVPDIQRYVTGLESVTKRLAVSIIEDGYGDPEDIHHLLVCALVSQRIKWKPDDNLMIKWITIALNALESNKKYNYSIKESHRVLLYNSKLNDANESLIKCSALIDELKSFETDLAMFRSIAHKKEYYRTIDYLRPEFMHFEHFVDHHWIPGIAYFSTLLDYDDDNFAKPFERFFKDLWTHSSSLNPRIYNDVSEMSEFRKNVVKLQKLTLLSKQGPKVLKSRESTGRTEKFTYELSKSWIPALVGAIEIKKPVHSYVTLDLSNDKELFKFCVIRYPSRDLKTSEPISNEHEEEIINGVKKLLKSGLKLNKAKPPCDLLKDSVLIIDDNRYEIVKNGERHSITDDTFTVKIDVDIVKRIKGIENAFIYEHSNGVSEDHEELFNNLLEECSSKCLNRLLMYLSGFKSSIELNKVSRDGSGIDHMVTVQDSEVYIFLLKLSIIYPCALRPVDTGKFESNCPIVLWIITSKIKNYCLKNAAKIIGKWPKLNDTKERKLWPHQQYILNNLMCDDNNGHFIWLNVGMGKTLIVMSYLKYLLSIQKLPEYIIYTLPKSALDTVIDEIKAFNFDINIIVPIKSVPDYFKNLNDVALSKSPKKWHVNIVLSDNHLRLANDVLVEVAPKSIFIIDEVHKALNDTQRTSVAIQLSSVSQKFIAFTGTPIIDSHTYKLIWWLEKIVKFEVNDNNFWVAANAMIARITDTKIPKIYTEVLAVMKNDVLEKYFKIVSPSLGGTNANQSIKDLKLATEMSYSACNEEMVGQTLKYIDKGVMLVAKDKSGQNELYKLLIKKVPANKVLLMTDTVNLTSESESDVSVVIVPINKSEGYNLTKMSVMITSVYPSNQATRTQIEGRINRIGQRAEELNYITVHCGILTRILKDHNTSKSLNAALESIHLKT